jgi:hypothetical protein
MPRCRCHADFAAAITPYAAATPFFAIIFRHTLICFFSFAAPPMLRQTPLISFFADAFSPFARRRRCFFSARLHTLDAA